MPSSDDLPEALARLVTLGRSPNVNLRPVLLRVVTDLFIRKPHHAPADLAQFETIVSHLLDDADPDTRLIVAEKLSRHPATPKALLDRFVAEHGVIATRVYEHAALDEAVLTSAALWAPTEVARVVARRRDLPPATVRALVDRPEPCVLRDLAANTDVALDRSSFQHLVRLARTDAHLARHLARKAADPIDMAPLFGLVSSEQRAAIIEAARRLELGRRQWGRLDGADAAVLAHMDRLVLRGDRDSFENTLAAALGPDGPILAPLFSDEGGEALALALAALGASPEMAARVFILGDPRIGRSVTRVRALVRIVEGLPAQAARRLITAITGAAARRRLPGLAAGAHTRRTEPLAGAEAQPVRHDALPASARRHG